MAPKETQVKCSLCGEELFLIRQKPKPGKPDRLTQASPATSAKCPKSSDGCHVPNIEI